MNLLINRVMKFSGACAGLYAAINVVIPIILEAVSYSGSTPIALWTALALSLIFLGYGGWSLGGWLSGYKGHTTTLTVDSNNG